MRGLFRRDPKSQDRLYIVASGASVGVSGDGFDWETLRQRYEPPLASFMVSLADLTPPPHTHTKRYSKAPEELFIPIPNIMSWLYDMNLSDWFLQPNPKGPTRKTGTRSLSSIPASAERCPDKTDRDTMESI